MIAVSLKPEFLKDFMNIAILKSRHEQLFKRLDSDSVAVVFAAPELGISYFYRQHSDFYYLTAFPEPESIAVFLPEKNGGSYILFSRASDPTLDAWYGYAIGQIRARFEFGAHETFAISEADKILPKLLAGKKHIYSNLGFSGAAGFNSKIISWLDQIDVENRPGLVDLGSITYNMRLIKDKNEITLMKRAAAIAVSGHLRAMKKCKPGIYEFELAAELLYEFIRLGGDRPAFETIIASGKDSCTLHYSKNNKQFAAGDMVVIDAGVEYEHYVSDVSRTYPINGKFSKEQQAIYEIVLAAQSSVTSEIRPGVNWNHLQATSDRVITDGLIELGLLSGNRDDLIAKGESKKFTIHKIGHWLGLDVHDVGDYFYEDGGRTLEVGMVFTVEPGVYLNPDTLANLGDRWKNIGVRIEDDILVTDGGCEVLTAGLLKEVSAIEKVMSRTYDF